HQQHIGLEHCSWRLYHVSHAQGCCSQLFLRPFLHNLDIFYLLLASLILLTLIATTKSLRPPPCEKGSSLCDSLKKAQLVALYMTLTLVVIDSSGSHYMFGSMVANQFNLDKPKH
ncbi:unnamed protein product, partial [Thlaspi arvense]